MSASLTFALEDKIFWFSSTFSHPYFIMIDLTLKSPSSASLISIYILGLGQRGRCYFCAACPNRKIYLEIRNAKGGQFVSVDDVFIFVITEILLKFVKKETTYVRAPNSMKDFCLWDISWKKNVNIEFAPSF